MRSFTNEGQVDLNMVREFQLKIDGVSMDTRKEWRKDIPEPKLNPSSPSSFLLTVTLMEGIQNWNKRTDVQETIFCAYLMRILYIHEKCL
jgi:hypothetical protein